MGVVLTRCLGEAILGKQKIRVSRVLTVKVVEDDPQFAELLTDVLKGSKEIHLDGVYESLEDFVNSRSLSEVNWLPDVLVIDVLSSKDTRFDGATFANALRTSGNKVGVVLMSSMPLDRVIKSFRKVNPLGWRWIQKSSRLLPEQILNAIFAAADEMVGA